MRRRFDLEKINRQNPVPLVHQLSEILRNKIIDGEYPSNSLFPTEEQLTEKFGVSRTTVRLALNKLVNEGLIYREQGRGTFVRSNDQGNLTHEAPLIKKRVSRDVIKVKSTTNIIKAAGMKPSSKVMRFSVEQPSEQVAKTLKIRLEHTVWYFERLRYADDIPVLLERIWIPQFLCPDLTENVLQGSLYEMFTKKYGLELSRARQVLRAVSLSSEDAKHLNEERGAPAMFVTGITYLKDGRPIEMENSLFNSEVMEFMIELGENTEYMRVRKMGSKFES